MPWTPFKSSKKAAPAAPFVNPNTTPWSKGSISNTPLLDKSEEVQSVQAKVVQHHYVRAQLKHINSTKGGALIEETLAALATTPQGRGCTRAQLLEGFEHMNQRLQTAPLTINFQASSFFGKPNTYISYTQMYERAVRTVNTAAGPSQQMRLKDENNNPAGMRVAADNKATFGKNMAVEGKYAGAGRVMSPGNLSAANEDARAGENENSNPHFNPRSKQIFAAINYGRRPHGSILTYGMSHMVLKPRFKTNALYFAGDTFFQRQSKVSADDQVSYGLLAAIYGKAGPAMRTDLYQSCILDGAIPDSTPSYETTLVLEAHLFEPLLFSGNIETIYLSNRDKSSSVPMSGAVWQNINSNARMFASTHGANIIFQD
jgi:hypothetical protein